MEESEYGSLIREALSGNRDSAQEALEEAIIRRDRPYIPILVFAFFGPVNVGREGREKLYTEYESFWSQIFLEGIFSSRSELNDFILNAHRFGVLLAWTDAENNLLIDINSRSPDAARDWFKRAYGSPSLDDYLSQVSPGAKKVKLKPAVGFSDYAGAAGLAGMSLLFFYLAFKG